MEHYYLEAFPKMIQNMITEIWYKQPEVFDYRAERIGEATGNVRSLTLQLSVIPIILLREFE